MADIRQLQGIGDLLAYPAQFEENYQQKVLNAQLTRAMLGQLGQAASSGLPAGDPPPFVLTPEQIAKMVPDPSAPTTMRGIMGNPVAGTALRGLGAVGQVLQIISGSRRGASAPRPPLAAYGTLLERQSADRWRREQAEKTQQFRTDTLEERRQHDRAMEAGKGRGGTLYERNPEAWRAMEKEKAGFATDKAKAMLPLAVEKAKALQVVKDAGITNTTKVMMERAPTVIDRANRVLQLLEVVQTGPLAGRYQEMMTTNIGLKNPDYARLRADLGLLVSVITQMHVGSRVVEHVAEQFNKMIGETIQDPDNLRGTIGEIIDYAEKVQARHSAGSGEAGSAPQTAVPTETPPASPDDLGHGFKLEVH